MKIPPITAFIILLTALVFHAPAFAQKTAKIKVTPLKIGKVQLARGTVKSILDLSKDISGCIVTYDRSEPKARKVDTTDFDKIDEVVKGGKTYLLLVSEINSGCNVTGECGAATDLTLVWLKLNSRLKIESKKAVAVQSCFWGDINIIDDGETTSETDPTGNFKFSKGVLSFEFETNRYKSDLEYTVTTVKYNRAAAEKGLIVKTEKRTRPVD
jgi:hypothetical protein